MGNLVFQATLGGQVNLVGPNTASTYNLNVPAVAGTLVTTGDTATVTNTMLSGPVSIANGGTNNSSFTAKSGNVAGLVFYDGTKLANDATVTDVGYDTATNTFNANNVTYSGAFTGSTGIFNLGSGQFYKDSSGNIGLGVTPSAWNVYDKALQVGSSAALYTYGVAELNLSANAYYNSGFKYLGTGASARYQQTSGAHQWYTAASGTAGNPISFTQAMTLDASGRLLVGTTSAAGSQVDIVDATGNNNYALTIARSATDAAAKSSAISIRSWSNAQSPICLVGAGIDDNTSNLVRIGGGFSNLNSATSIAFYTAATNTTLTGTERMRIDSSGNVIVTGSGGLGYGTGSGGTVTQATNRTTGVTLNKTNGAITLVSAAGSTSYQSFTVTNSTVAATDTVIVNQKSGTDLYEVFVTAVAAGSFRITFATTGGTTTEQPVFNFSVIKAVTA